MDEPNLYFFSNAKRKDVYFCIYLLILECDSVPQRDYCTYRYFDLCYKCVIYLIGKYELKKSLLITYSFRSRLCLCKIKI